MAEHPPPRTANGARTPVEQRRIAAKPRVGVTASDGWPSAERSILAPRTVESHGPGKTVGRDRRASRNGATRLGGPSPIAKMASLDVRTRRTLPLPGPVGACEATRLRMTHYEVRHP